MVRLFRSRWRTSGYRYRPQRKMLARRRSARSQLPLSHAKATPAATREIGAPCELPNGHRCSKGTCHFTHDKLNPGGPCYRDPKWPGPFLDKVLKNKLQMERIKNARENNAKHLNVTKLPICADIAIYESDQLIDVNGVGANCTLVSAVSAVSENFVDDQGEHTDPATDFAVMANTATPNHDDADVNQEEAASRWAGKQTQGGGAAP
eukprot:6191252-Pleurochrysis_carterae.AAC.3